MTTISTAGLDRSPFAATSRAARGAGQFDLYRRAVRLAGIGIWECDLATDRLSWSEGVYDLFGIDRSARLDRRDIVQLYDEDSRREMEWLRARAIRDGSGFSIDARIHRLDGTCRWMRLTAGVELQNGRPRCLFGTKQDVTEERVLRERLRTLAESDPLTMLANRAMFDRWLQADVDGCGSAGALLLIDIDRFKAVNDINGHAAGDACLRRVADELRRSFRDAALVARIGGDEFAVLMRQGVGARQIAFRLDDFLSAIGRPVRAGGRVVTLGASAGVALPGPEDDDAIAREGMFATADAALYAAKAAGRNTYRIAGRQPPERHLRQA